VVVIHAEVAYDNSMRRIVQARLDPATLELLTKLRRRTGLSDSELLRRGLSRLADEQLQSRRHRIVGLGQFASRTRDLGSKKRHLRGFGRS